MMRYKHSRNNLIIIVFIGYCLFTACGHQKTIFSTPKTASDIKVTGVDIDKIVRSYDTSCTCHITFKSGIRILESDKDSFSSAREYYGECFFGIGKIFRNQKTGLWTYYSNDIRVAEDYWLADGRLMWVKYYDQNGKVYMMINIGAEE